ncbi:MAG TPA: RNA-binding S4 domain-containing protein [Firmicutes bacterium]|nr:RNA-binding S4 domain-containing protein [Bacillota bacterium]
MRLDKFLKVSRLVKRRTVAKQLCDGGLVMINGRIAKAGSEVSEGDVIRIRYGDSVASYKVVEIRESATAQEALQMVKRLDPGDSF